MGYIHPYTSGHAVGPSSAWRPLAPVTARPGRENDDDDDDDEDDDGWWW